MDKPTFSNWLAGYYCSTQQALLICIETRDRLQYVIGAALKAEYMEKIGNSEQPVLENELDALMLEKKKDLIQRAINRGETLNLEKIEEEVRLEREKKISALKASSVDIDGIPSLTEEETEELNSMYHMMVKNFHPSANPGLSRQDKDIYGQALEAYKRQDLKSLKLLSDVLVENQKDEIRETILMYREMKKAGLIEEKKEDINEIADRMAMELKRDYALAEKLFGVFKCRPADKELYEKTMEYVNAAMEIKNDIEKITQGFPYNTQETLKSPEKTAEYLKSLEIRNAQALNKKAELTEKIKKMIAENKGGAVN